LALVVAALLLAVGCGSETAAGGSGGKVSCKAGEMVVTDGSGNPYCAPVGGGGTIDVSGGDVSGGDVSGDVTGGEDGGAEVGGGGADGGGSGDADDASASADGADVDAGPIDPWKVCPPVKGSGKEHGKACASHDECLYGYCMTGGFLTGYDASISYCTKNNRCCADDLPCYGASKEPANCYVDDGAPQGVQYRGAKEMTNEKNDKFVKGKPVDWVCARGCKTDAECASWNPAMPHCILNSTKYVSMGTQGLCGNDPTR
jgi:hypothetical protein